jgi:predicted transcriptional regulator
MARSSRLSDGRTDTSLPREVRDRIDELAEALGVSRAAWIRMAVFAALRREDAEVSR